MRRTEPNELHLAVVCSELYVVGVRSFQSCSVWLPQNRMLATFSSLVISLFLTTRNPKHFQTSALKARCGLQSFTSSLGSAATQ